MNEKYRWSFLTQSVEDYMYTAVEKASSSIAKQDRYRFSTASVKLVLMLLIVD